MKHQKSPHNKKTSSSVLRWLFPSRQVLGMLFAVLFFTACNTEEGKLPTGEEPDYPEFTFDKVGEIDIDIEALWTEIDFTQYHYEGDQPLLFVRINKNIVALDLDQLKVRWILPESAFGIKPRDEAQISVFDRDNKLLITFGEIWKVVDPETGSVEQSYNIRDYGIKEPFAIGYNYVNEKAFIYTITRDLDLTFIYQLDFSMSEADLIKSFQRPNIFLYNYFPVLFPYDESEDKLFLTFPILEEGENPGAYFPYIHPSSLEIDSHYLDPETFERRQMNIDEQIVYHDGILSYGTSSGDLFSYSLKDGKLVFQRYVLDRLRNVERGRILIWKDNYINVFDSKTGDRILSSRQYPADVQTTPLIHPSEDIVIIPYRDRILMVELVTERLLVEHPIAEQNTPYEAVFFDSRGRLCVLGRDQRLEIFNLPI